MVAPFTPPAYDKAAFNCPHCHAYAKQQWHKVGLSKLNKTPYEVEEDISRLFQATTNELSKWASLHSANTVSINTNKLHRVYATTCDHCGKFALWVNGRQLFPSSSSAPLPSPDLPKDLSDDYEEARMILADSPRGAAALLRLVVQKLCKELGESGENINEDISKMVAKGLSQDVVDVMDSVRVIGNNAVHPLKMDLSDNKEIVEALFGLINIVVEKMITEPNRIRDVKSKLPSQDQETIKKRDAKSD